MSSVIFRTIDGIVRPINVGGQSVKSKSRKTKSKPEYQLKKNHYSDFRSFTVPNVKCKTCGQLVYYYEHPSGSKVLFDELGPPWPLHPCFAAGQSKKNKPVKPPVKTVIKKEKGWFPVVIEHVRQLQAEVEVRARTEKGELLFTIAASPFRSRKIQLNQVKYLLALMKSQTGTHVRLQLHDGKSSWEQQGTLKTLSGKPLTPVVPLVLTEKKFKTLTPLQNGLIVIKEDKIHFDFLFYGKKYHQSVGGNQWHTLRHKLDRLKLYFRKDKTGRRFIIYAIDPVARDFISFAFNGEAKPQNLVSPKASDKRVTLEDIFLEDVDAEQIKLLGKIDDCYITFYMPRRYLRADESIDALLDGELTILLEHAGGAECHLSVGDVTGQKRKSLRGKVAILSCTNMEQMTLPQPTDFVIKTVDVCEDAHLQLSVTSQRKSWDMSLFVSDFQRNYLVNRFAAVADLPLKQRIYSKKNVTRLYVGNRCVGYYKKMVPGAKPTLKEVVSYHMSEDTLLGMAFSKALNS